MIEIRQTDTFRGWLSSLRDSRAKQRIASRIQRMKFGNPGDVKPVGEGVSEMRVDVGKGYRVYFSQRGAVMVVLLCGGHKGSQKADITQAKQLAHEWKD